MSMKKLFFFIFLAGHTVMAQNAVSFTRLSEKGTPLVFFPHIGCSSEMWKSIAGHYQQTHAVYRADFAKKFIASQPEWFISRMDKFLKEIGR